MPISRNQVVLGHYLLALQNKLALMGVAPSKQDMAASSAVSLPETVLQRPKTGFTVPVREWLVKS